jgi:hypothetical protein
MSLSFSSLRRASTGRKPVAIAALCTALLLVSAAEASAAVRFAAPGGTAAASTACEQANPCSLLNAADRFAPNTGLAAGDEIVVEPGNYDLGPQEVIVPQEETRIHGVAGEPRPIITIHGDGGTGAFLVNEAGDTLRWLEIVSLGRRTGLALDVPGIVDEVVVRATTNLAACNAEDGLLRDSACLSAGDGGTALGISMNVGQTDKVRLRNVTAIATGANSHGLDVEAAGDDELSVDAVGVLARGTAEDVFAGAFSRPPAFPIGARVTVNLDHSDFAQIKTENDAGGGTATVTGPGSGTNITAEPLLAADGYHELLGSPTIDQGATDPSSGTTDVDGEQRVFGPGADIGADEFQVATATSLACSPASVVVGGSTTCTARVGAAVGSPTGIVRFSAGGQGSLSGGGSCSLAPTSTTESSCHLAYVPGAVGSHALTASYQGDAVHRASEGSTSVQAVAARATAPNTTLKKKPARRTSSHLATFTFSSAQPGAHFQCKLDKGHFKPCRSPFEAKKLKRGRHSFQVRAVNNAGEADPTPAAFRWRVS